MSARLVRHKSPQSEDGRDIRRATESEAAARNATRLRSRKEDLHFPDRPPYVYPLTSQHYAFTRNPMDRTGM